MKQDQPYQNLAKTELSQLESKSPIYRFIKILYLIALILSSASLILLIVLSITINEFQLNSLLSLLILYLIVLIIIIGIYLSLIYVFFGKRIAILNFGLILVFLGNIFSNRKHSTS
ncbi:hypothetical protein BH10PAT1_BH10PAT1_6320 [soil metagenome]